MLSCFHQIHLIPERHGQTDGRTDRIAISIWRVSVLTRDKNVLRPKYSSSASTKYKYNKSNLHQSQSDCSSCTYLAVAFINIVISEAG